ncbi:MAG: KamA family radical SAM protein [Parachlamydiaceae bacterium]|nr:KamA family radical SAM protein [Parachlamydiaceae bacterium]
MSKIVCLKNESPLPLFPQEPLLWRQLLRQNFVDWKKLADFLQLTEEQRQQILTKPKFALNLPLRIAQKIAKATLDDPILKQFIPTQAETEEIEGFSLDPVGDCGAAKSEKLLHKYKGRALLLCTSACAMHCRYCFRQNFDYAVGVSHFSNEIELIRQDSSISEVILSGGDPLSLSDRVLGQLMQELASIPHVTRLRLHTRFPIGIPERIDTRFLQMIEGLSCQVWMVIHANHPLELDEEVLSRLKSLQKLGVVLLNQAVLLRDVNDNIDVLAQLCERLVDHGILPYYLHQLDRVKGTAHFEVDVATGLQLVKELATRLPGYAVPRYVKEEEGFPSKTFLG